MPKGPWTPEHRAAYEETMRLRAEARERGEVWVKPTRERRRAEPARVSHDLPLRPEFDLSGVEANLSDLTAEVAQLGVGVKSLARHVEQSDATERIRQTAVRIEDTLALARSEAKAAKPPDQMLVDAFRHQTARIARLEGMVVDQGALLAEALLLLRRIDSRPARVIEFRPNHAREKDGGTPVRMQRSRLGLTHRSRGRRTMAPPEAEAVG